MKKIISIVLIMVVVYSCSNKKEQPKIVKQESNYYSNPILQGFYPDPSICKANENYYLINSSFAYFPGIPIFKSPDLVNWEQIGNVLNRPEQLDLSGFGVSRGIFAPAIRYHNGIFYVVCTLVDGKNNFVVTATNPEGPWSNPTWIPEVEGIDPSLFFDKNGKSYIIYNSIPPNNVSLYDGHRTIKMYEFVIENLKVIGQEKLLINGGTDISKKTIWIEGPHIFQKYGFYYLMAAEGGTSEGHSEVVFRSKTIEGPYESYNNNPILTQRHLDDNKLNPITSTGHADMVEDDNGNWWGVFLGCRPYENNHYNTGRETFMAPVEWQNEWPIFNLNGDVVKKFYPTPNNVVKADKSFKYSGEYTHREEFNNSELGFEWLFLRTPKERWYQISDDALMITTRPETVSENVNPSFIGHRQQHIKGNVSTEMLFETDKTNEKAGLITFQNESHFYYLCKSFKNGKAVIQLYQSSENGMEEMVSTTLETKQPIKLKIESQGTIYNFLYSEGNDTWVNLKEGVDARFLSTKQAGGFVGTIYAMYTTSLGLKSSNKAVFNWFEIVNSD
ncbi:glycoside hydrolase family 43 protein [Mariniflexile sp.]|uniref:glycoside hydrolase family 43 protein n=1 Tax=Mariniflexile sp. TaxID=1979402 RepID=UPI0040470CB3